ncbi:transposable element Tc1 transposase [Trichonephila clavipes]|nr:transposable element Tc1 transposase [Trichonephila clavipes]
MVATDLRPQQIGRTDCQNSTLFIVINHQTCDLHTSDHHDHSQTADRAKCMLVATAAPTSTQLCLLQLCLPPSGWNRVEFGSRSIVFSDESCFQLCPDDHRRRVWRHPVCRDDTVFTIARHTGPNRRVTVWGSISFESRTPLVIIKAALLKLWGVPPGGGSNRKNQEHGTITNQKRLPKVVPVVSIEEHEDLVTLIRHIVREEVQRMLAPAQHNTQLEYPSLVEVIREEYNKHYVLSHQVNSQQPPNLSPEECSRQAIRTQSPIPIRGRSPVPRCRSTSTNGRRSPSRSPSR